MSSWSPGLHFPNWRHSWAPCMQVSSRWHILASCRPCSSRPGRYWSQVRVRFPAENGEGATLVASQVHGHCCGSGYRRPLWQSWLYGSAGGVHTILVATGALLGPAMFWDHFSESHSLSGLMTFPFLAIVPGQDKHFHSAVNLIQRLSSWCTAFPFSATPQC